MGDKNNQYLVFLVEDDKFYMELLENYFASKKRFKTMRFMTGEDCVAHLNQKPDLVILDYLLDKENKIMDGRGVYRKIKEHSPKSRIVVVSAQQSADVVFGLVKEGMHNYVMKDKQTFQELDQLLQDYTRI